jgi:membrane dipeptidase
MRNKAFTYFVFSVILFGVLCTSCDKAMDEEDLAKKAREIHDKVLTIDTHADTPSRLLRDDWKIGERHEPGERMSGKIDLPRMAEGGLDAEFFAAYVGQGPLTEEGYARAKERVHALIDAIHKMCDEYSDMVELATSPEDAYRLEKEGKRAAFIGIENGYAVGQDLSLVEEYYNKGVRYITLCHGGDNDICDSSGDRRNPEDNGMSEFGKRVVAECNRLGIMIDVSHISDRSFFDLLDVTESPVIASHSSVRALCDHNRNLSDEMLEALAQNGGVIQICFVSSFLKTPKPNPEREKALEELREKYGSRREIQDEELRQKVYQMYRDIYEKYPSEGAQLKDVVDHIDYVVELIGIDHVGIGTDFDGGGGVQGCNDVSEMPNITEELLRRGYSEQDIQKIWGGNLIRVFNNVIEVAAQY